MAAELSGIGLITGAGSGIGRATAHAFLHAGCTRLSLTDLNPTTLEQTRSQLSALNPAVQILLSAGNVTDPSFVDTLLDAHVTRFGRLDYAVNCAGMIGPWAVSHETSLEDHDRVMDLNYRSVWLCARAEIKAMLSNGIGGAIEEGEDSVPRQRGSIVHISSGLGFVGRAGAPAYCASKAAILGLMRGDAIDYSPHGIRVNCVCPGITETPLATQNGDPEIMGAMQKIIDNSVPMKRWAKPSEIANAVVFLCSDKASFVQGHALAVDGGFLIQ